MPNIITHVLFGDEVLESLSEDKGELFEGRKQLLEIGANGPDFLFFHGMNQKNFWKHTLLRKVGNQAHSHSTNAFYESALASIKKEEDEEVRNDMIVYLCGHLCHWALDSVTHPYIFYRTGNCKGQSAWWHHRFESLIDAIMLKVKRDCTIRDYKAYEICEASLEQARAIARIYVPVIKNIYKTDVRPYQILESLNDWCFIQKVLYDPEAAKFEALEKIEAPLNATSFLSGYFVPNEPEDPFDTMNLLHKKWCHPCDDTVVSTESFFDLYDRARSKALNAIRLLFIALEDEKNEGDFIHFINNQSYDTGLSTLEKMQYFDEVYKK